MACSGRQQHVSKRAGKAGPCLPSPFVVCVVYFGVRFYIKVGGVFFSSVVCARSPPCAYDGHTAAVSLHCVVCIAAYVLEVHFGASRPMTATATVCGRTFYTCYIGYTYYVPPRPPPPHGFFLGSIVGYAVPVVQYDNSMCMVAMRAETQRVHDDGLIHIAPETELYAMPSAIGLL